MPESVESVKTLPPRLMAEIAECSFYPSLVAETVGLGLGERLALRILNPLMLVRTERQLLICHIDEGEGNRTEAVATTEIVALRAIDSVVLTRALQDPENRSGLSEAWLTIVWGAARRVDLGPAGCDDPACEADHGYSGVIQPDDLTVRMSPQADGDNARRLVAFGTRLQAVVG